MPAIVEEVQMPPDHSVGCEQDVKRGFDGLANRMLPNLLRRVEHDNGQICSSCHWTMPTCPLIERIFPDLKHARRRDDQAGVDLTASMQAPQIDGHLHRLSQTHVIRQKGSSIWIVVHFPEPLHALNLVRVSTHITEKNCGYRRSLMNSGMVKGFADSPSAFIVEGAFCSMDLSTAVIDSIRASTVVVVGFGLRVLSFSPIFKTTAPSSQKQTKYGTNNRTYKP